MTENTVYRYPSPQYIGPDYSADKGGPFGYKNVRDGLDFSRSVTNRNSRLVRVVQFVRDDCVTPVSRHNIIGNVFGRINHTDSRHKGRSWASGFFAALVKAGFLEKVGRGSQVRYIEGRNASLIPR